MKVLWVSLACSLALARALAAQQVRVEVSIDQEQFLPNETLTVSVRIINFSGQTLSLGKSDDWLRFSVEAKNNYLVPKLGEVPVKGEFQVPSSSAATKRVNLAPYFQLTYPGHYQVTASVRIELWDQLLSSRAQGFYIVAGNDLWQQEFGVPNPPELKDQPPEVRKYTLQSTGNRLYVRVSDPSGNQVYRVLPLGALVSFSRPEAQIDRSSNLHILNQFSARSFNYYAVNPSGELILRRTYEYGNARPTLRADKEGTIVVSGGLRRPATSDFPPALTPHTTSDQKNVQP